jgi:hypothetical protein
VTARVGVVGGGGVGGVRGGVGGCVSGGVAGGLVRLYLPSLNGD